MCSHRRTKNLDVSTLPKSKNKTTNKKTKNTRILKNVNVFERKKKSHHHCRFVGVFFHFCVKINDCHFCSTCVCFFFFVRLYLHFDFCKKNIFLFVSGRGVKGEENEGKWKSLIFWRFPSVCNHNTEHNAYIVTQKIHTTLLYTHPQLVCVFYHCFTLESAACGFRSVCVCGGGWAGGGVVGGHSLCLRYYQVWIRKIKHTTQYQFSSHDPSLPQPPLQLSLPLLLTPPLHIHAHTTPIAPPLPRLYRVLAKQILFVYYDVWQCSLLLGV